MRPHGERLIFQKHIFDTGATHHRFDSFPRQCGKTVQSCQALALLYREKKLCWNSVAFPAVERHFDRIAGELQNCGGSRSFSFFLASLIVLATCCHDRNEQRHE